MNSRARSHMAKKKLKRLSEVQIKQVAGQFRALSQPLRLRLINELMEGEQNVSKLVKTTGANQSNVSKHLGEMHKAKLLGRRRDGLSIYYYISDSRVIHLCEVMCAKPERPHKGTSIEGNSEM
jgi:DNA-binding transcriptional ArsR family regulator